MTEPANEKKVCYYCEEKYNPEELTEFDGKLLCPTCLEMNTVICDECGTRVWAEDSFGPEGQNLCRRCFSDRYVHCTGCMRVIEHDAAFYNDEDDPYCYECFHSRPRIIHDYSYKPEPIFFGDGPRYFGVELEMDKGGELDRNAEELINIANKMEEHIYVKHDGSLDDGFEVVTEPMSMPYHMEKMPWKEVLEKAVSLGFRGHCTSTAGYHIHVSRLAFGDTAEAQDAAIARLLYFIEKHWNEMLTFSRRSVRQMDRWAARYGYKEQPREILDEAKKGHEYGRYVCVNLGNADTVEFRMFQSTLKLNTFLATLQFVDHICDVAVFMTDEEVRTLSWSAFVSAITEPELVQYLRERRLYVNDVVCGEEEL